MSIEKMQETLPMLGDGVNDEQSNSQIIPSRDTSKIGLAKLYLKYTLFDIEVS
jgi:hypothetical protein